jgi:hypothetical protein
MADIVSTDGTLGPLMDALLPNSEGCAIKISSSGAKTPRPRKTRKGHSELEAGPVANMLSEVQPSLPEPRAKLRRSSRNPLSGRAAGMAGILPGVGESALHFGNGLGKATTKLIPPGAAARPMSMLADLSVEERYASTYSCSFNKDAPPGIAKKEVFEGMLAPINHHFPRRYVPSVNGFLRGQLTAQFFARA